MRLNELPKASCSEENIITDRQLITRERELLHAGFMPMQEVDISMVANPREAIERLKMSGENSGRDSVIIQYGYQYKLWTKSEAA